MVCFSVYAGAVADFLVLLYCQHSLAHTDQIESISDQKEKE